ncbi:MAG TPA: aromatic amino acid ammonia-lyase, partial [Lacibacter sp.]|nr:aromatic amino acid ammonia-lyase [Lacibacter sp.]
MQEFQYGTDRLTVAAALGIAEGRIKGLIAAEAAERIRASAAHVEDIVEQDLTVYGVNTGFGILANSIISREDAATLQYKILQSHSVGVGASIPHEIVRIMLLTKVHALAQGYSGVQLTTLERICWHLEHDILPVVPSKGSVGASGDLAPLAHLFLPLIGLGACWYKGQVRPTADVLGAEGLEPVKLGPKEGLALINGTQFILSFAVKAVQRMHNCLEAADIIGAMSLEALSGTQAPFDARLHELRPFAGNRLVAQRLRLLLQGSEIMQSH